uniref:AP complex mu/sigma subunit domain-containing protein n=1 Tax=Monodelphis domestica TaxID=13616 RepID=F7ATM1_MONDO
CTLLTWYHTLTLTLTRRHLLFLPFPQPPQNHLSTFTPPPNCLRRTPFPAFSPQSSEARGPAVPITQSLPSFSAGQSLPVARGNSGAENCEARRRELSWYPLLLFPLHLRHRPASAPLGAGAYAIRWGKSQAPPGGKGVGLGSGGRGGGEGEGEERGGGGEKREREEANGAGPYGGRRGTRCARGCRMMRFMLLFSRQGKLRLQKWYLAMSDKERKKMVRELMQVVLARKPKMCSFLEWRDLKVVYKRYASLYFCCAIEGQDNELITLELIHRYVELLDKYFGSVCELDIIFTVRKAYLSLDEFLMSGDVQDTSKKSVLKAIEQADLLQEEDESPRFFLEEMGLA